MRPILWKQQKLEKKNKNKNKNEKQKQIKQHCVVVLRRMCHTLLTEYHKKKTKKKHHKYGILFCFK